MPPRSVEAGGEPRIAHAAGGASGETGWAAEAWPVKEANGLERGQPRSLLGASLQPGDVLGALFDSPDDQLAAAAAFFAAGIASGERCLLVAERPFIEQVEKALSNAPPAVRQQPALVAETNRDRVLRDWVFDGETVVRLIEGAAAEARQAGFSGLRVGIEMTWALRPAGNVEEIGRFADLLGRSLAALPAVALLLYDRVRFPPPFVEAVLRAHPLLVRRERVVANPYFAPAEAREGRRRLVDGMIAALDRAASPMPSLPSLPAVLDALPQGVLLCDAAGIVRAVNRPAAELLEVAAEAVLSAPLAMLFADGEPPPGWPRADGPDLRNLRVRRGDGRARWVRASARRLGGGTGGLLVLLDTLDPAWPLPFGAEDILWHSNGRQHSTSGRNGAETITRFREPVRHPPAPNGNGAGSACRVLVVSAAPALAETLSLELIGDGHAVIVATTGEEARQALARDPVDLAIVGLDGSEEAGWEMARELRTTDRTLPVLLAAGWPLDRAAVDAAGANGVLSKPVSRADLGRALLNLQPVVNGFR
jgi:CheY-like chemotaxis protein